MSAASVTPSIGCDPVLYRLGARSGYWAELLPSDGDVPATWRLRISSRRRASSACQAIVLETTPSRPLVTAIVRGETYPLPIGWHERRRGLRLGGERRLPGNAVATWEMKWTPLPAMPDTFHVDLRIRVTGGRADAVEIRLPTPLFQPHVLSLHGLPGACSAMLARSEYNDQSVAIVAPSSEARWDEDARGFVIRIPQRGRGGSPRVSVAFAVDTSDPEAKRRLLRHALAILTPSLHPLDTAPRLSPAEAVQRLARPENAVAVGTERLYLRSPGADPATFHAGHPHYPLEGLHGLWEWTSFHPSDWARRLIRFGALGVAADFQVMGSAMRDSEPNKGAFWDRWRLEGGHADHAGGQTHGLAANARIASSLFALHFATGEPLFRQSALNICQWLILKQNAEGFYNGARVHATRGCPDDGRFVPDPDSLDGVGAILPFVWAFRATRNEVFIQSAWKVANHALSERLPRMDGAAPLEIATLAYGLLALNGEAANSRLESALVECAGRLQLAMARVMSPLETVTVSNTDASAVGDGIARLTAAGLNEDGHFGGILDCADVLFRLHAKLRDRSLLRCACAALARTPSEFLDRSWHTLRLFSASLLSVATVLPELTADFDRLALTRGWQTYTPDPATDAFLRVHGEAGAPVDYLPLVCRGSDQLLIVAFGPPSLTWIAIRRSGKTPLVHDLIGGGLDTHAPLHPIPGEPWGRLGVFTVDA